MLRDLRDAWSWIQKLVRRVERVESGALLENSSITGGRMRFIGGTLRVDSGGRIELEGTLEGGGTFLWTGTLTNNGPLTQNGPWNMVGDGTATGEWTQIGPWHLNGDGSISGDADITGILTLLSELRVSSVGKITVGNMVIDPAGGGSVTFPGGAMVQADPGGGLRMIQGSNRVYVGSGLVSLQMGSRFFGLSSSGFTIDGLPTIAAALANGAAAGTVWVDVTGQMYRVIP